MHKTAGKQVTSLYAKQFPPRNYCNITHLPQFTKYLPSNGSSKTKHIKKRNSAAVPGQMEEKGAHPTLLPKCLFPPPLLPSAHWPWSPTPSYLPSPGPDRLPVLSFKVPMKLELIGRTGHEEAGAQLFLYSKAPELTPKDKHDKLQIVLIYGSHINSL